MRMSINKALILCAAYGLSGELYGGNFTIKDGTSEWWNPANYYENDQGGSAVPGGSDTITVPSHASVRLDAADIDSWAIYEAVERVIPTDDSSRLAINVSDGVASVTTPYSASNQESPYYYPVYTGAGALVKTGGGELRLGGSEKKYCSAGGRCFDYYCSIAIQGGQITLPQEVTTGGSFAYGPVSMSSNTAFVIARARSGLNSVWVESRFWSLNGYGTVSSDSSTSTMSIQGWQSDQKSVFSGKLTGTLQMAESTGRIAFLGGESDFSSRITVLANYNSLAGGYWGGYIEVFRLGTVGQASSIGRGAEVTIGQNGGGILYMGEGETCDKAFVLGDTIDSGGYCFIDAGAHGAINWTGEWKQKNGAVKTHRMLLTGSNATECVMSGPIADAKAAASDGERMYPIYIVKRGTGIWRMADNAWRTSGGGFAIEEGTLRYDSIAEEGVVCSLGTATNLTENYTGAALDDHRAQYAFLLGSASGGTMEFTGLEGGSCSTRHVAVNGNGRFKVSGAGDFSFSGFSSFVENSVLTLDTSRSVEDGEVRIGGITDGPYPLAVVKEGSGTVVLVSGNDFTGGLNVREGTVKVIGEQPYRWYKWSVTNKGIFDDRYKATIGESESARYVILQMEEFALFDNNGNRIDRSLSMSSLTNDFDQMSAGSVAQVTPLNVATISGAAAGKNIEQFFNGGGGSRSGTWMGTKLKNENYYPFCSKSKPEYWYTFIERLPENASTAASFDLAASYGRNASKGAFSATAVRIEGSIDGIHWEHVIDKDVDLPDTFEEPRWYANPSEDLVRKSGYDYELLDHVGYGMPRTGTVTNKTSEIIGVVAVYSGAVLEASGTVVLHGLEVSSVANGTIRGFTFSPNGTLSVDSLGECRDRVELPIVFDGCAGLEHLQGWTLNIADDPESTAKIKISHGRLVVVRPRGFSIIFK